MASILKDNTNIPDDILLSNTLNDTFLLWNNLVQYTISKYNNTSKQWKFYGIKSGWILAIFSAKRRLFNLVPNQGFFEVHFTLSEFAAAKARDLGFIIPKETSCVCGYGLVIKVKDIIDIDKAITILNIKGD